MYKPKLSLFDIRLLLLWLLSMALRRQLFDESEWPSPLEWVTFGGCVTFWFVWILLKPRAPIMSPEQRRRALELRSGQEVILRRVALSLVLYWFVLRGASVSMKMSLDSAAVFGCGFAMSAISAVDALAVGWRLVLDCYGTSTREVHEIVRECRRGGGPPDWGSGHTTELVGEGAFSAARVKA